MGELYYSNFKALANFASWQTERQGSCHCCCCCFSCANAVIAFTSLLHYTHLLIHAHIETYKHTYASAYCSEV